MTSNIQQSTNRRARWATVVALTAIVAIGASGAPAAAQPDLQITSMSVTGTPRVGTCNTVSMTVRNFGNEFSGQATLDIKLFTYPAATPNANRFEKALFIGPLQPGAQATFNVTQVDIKVAGQTRIQALVDSTEETTESNESNNVHTITQNVSANCTPIIQTPTLSRGANAPGCDVQAFFEAPSGTSVPGSSQYTYQVRFTNKGSATCSAFKVKLSRYNNGSCSGYGSQVGGSRAWASIGSLAANASQTGSFSERRTPSTGKACLKISFSPNSYSDDNNPNHRIQKAVAYN